MLSTIVEKVLAGLVVLLIIAGSVLGIMYRSEHKQYLTTFTELAATKAEVKTAADANAALKMQNDAVNASFNSLISQLATLKLQQAVDQGNLNEALKANQAWADAAVPVDVWNSVLGIKQQAPSAAPASGTNTSHVTR